jgi:hypothetical protein
MISLIDTAPSGFLLCFGGLYGRRNAGNRPVVDFSIAHQRGAEFVQSFGKIVIFCENPDDDSTILQSGLWKRQHSMKRLPEAETKKRVSVPAEGGSGFRSSLTRGPLWRCGSLRQKVLTERRLFAIII